MIKHTGQHTGQASQGMPAPTASAQDGKQPAPDQQEASHLKNLNLYAYAALNPIIYSDPTGHVPIIQEWWKAYDNADDPGKVGHIFLFILAYLAHIIVNLAVLIFAVIAQPLSPVDLYLGCPPNYVGVRLWNYSCVTGRGRDPSVGQWRQD